MFSFQEPSSKPLFCQKLGRIPAFQEFLPVNVLLTQLSHGANTSILKPIELGKLDNPSSLSPERHEEWWGHRDLTQN